MLGGHDSKIVQIGTCSSSAVKLQPWGQTCTVSLETVWPTCRGWEKQLSTGCQTAGCCTVTPSIEMFVGCGGSECILIALLELLLLTE
jgi:hypothetical protein